MNRLTLPAAALIILALAPVRAGDNSTSDFVILHRPLSKAEALNLAIAHNGTILQAQKEVQAAAGVAIQTKAIVYPHVNHTAFYNARQDSLIETNEDREFGPVTVDFPPPIGPIQSRTITFPKVNNQAWAADVQITQSIYEGGRLLSALRASRLINEQAVLAYESIVADTLLQVSTAYDDVLRAAMQISVRHDSVVFLGGYLGETTDKFNSGALPEFDVLRQGVEVANAKAAEVQAIGDYRVAKQKFVSLLGYDLPVTATDDLALSLTTPLEARPYDKALSVALSEALQHRTEIAALQKEELLRDEAVINAKAGYKPSVQAFAGYELTSRVQTRSANEELHGGLIGGQVSWSIFDGFLTKGRVDEAVARREKAGEAKAETTRQVELQVRTAWSDLRTARAVLEAQSENVRKGRRGLELSQIRYNEGASTQIDVLDAQSALTTAHGEYVDALRNHSVARANLIRATGADLHWR
ncbi:MAG: TolC family protein [Chthoniobacterales bacterium]